MSIHTASHSKSPNPMDGRPCILSVALELAFVHGPASTCTDFSLGEWSRRSYLCLAAGFPSLSLQVGEQDRVPE